MAVAYPRSTAQVSTIARISSKYRIPIIPYSGGSSLEGNFSAPFGGISVDFAYMDKIIQFNKDDMDIVVQPSLGWQDLNEQLSKMGSGLFFPIDPGKCTARELTSGKFKLTGTRPECQDWRYDWNELLWHECCKIRHHEGLGNQLDGCPC